MNKKEYKNFLHADFSSVLNYIVHNYSDKVAFKYFSDGNWINKTYNDFYNDVANTSNSFKELFGERKKIYIKQLKSYNWFVVFFSTIVSNNISVVLNPELSDEEFQKENNFLDIDYIIDSFEFNQIRTQKENIDKNIPKNCSVIIKTSGTTDWPKYVMLSQKNIICSLLNEISKINLNSNGKSLAVLPLWHLYELCLEIMFNFITCNTTIFNDVKDNFLLNLKRFKPDHLFVVPSLVKLLSLIYSSPNQDNEVIKENLKIIFCGSASLSNDLVLFFQNQGVTLVQGYGATECSPLVTVQELTNIVVGTVGKEGICNKIRIKNGEIQVKGKNVMLGYYKNKEATRAVFEGKWYKTGDLGLFDKNKNLIIHGRKNSLIVLSNGEKFYPEEVEEVILHNPKIDYCKIIFRGQKIYAEIFSNSLSKSELLDYIKVVNSNLILHKRISETKILDSQPQKTDLGKTYRK